jgi:hypothetical protein
MVYMITGLSPAPFAPLFDLDDATLAMRGARRVVADRRPGYPCRVSLEDAEPGDALLLVNHVSQAGNTPYRASHAIYVRRGATVARFLDAPPPVFATRWLSLRGFDVEAMMRDARLTGPGEADAAIRAMLDDPAIAFIDVHNAAPGCFAARVERA